MIRLVSIDSTNFKECLALKVGENQQSFVCSNSDSLARAYVYYDLAYPFAIYEEKVMIGFALLRENPDDQSYFLWEYMIDERYQGRGYGSQALEEIIEWVKTRDNVTKLMTTYKIGNEVARHLYDKYGFKHFYTCEEEQEVDLILHLK